MEFDFFKEIMKQYSSNLGVVSPQFQGEPLLHPQFLQICQYLEETRKNFRFNTNGQLLTPKLIDELAKMKYLVGITFSLDGITKETFERLRIGSDFHKIMENVTYAIPRIPCSVNFVLMEENQFELPAVVKHFIGIPVTASIVTDDGGLPTSYFWKPEERSPCFPDSAIILSDGKVVACCRDHLYTEIMGDLQKQSLSEVWFGEKYRYLWKMQTEGRWNELPLCSNCSTWQCETIKEGRIKKYIEGVIAIYYPFWCEFRRDK
jgi:MoaA/NifB/PqqE/SkfB family radical SAM enzyme